MHRLLGQAEEQLASRRRFATVESESELVEIVVEMILTGRSLMRSHQPSLKKRDNKMVAWQEVFTLRLSPLHLPVVDITDQIKIGW